MLSTKKNYTPAQFNDRIVIREQSLCLAYSILNAIGKLDSLPISTEGNQVFEAVRDKLADLLTEIQAKADA